MTLSLLNDGLLRDALLTTESQISLVPRIIILGDSFGASRALAEPEQRGKDVYSNGTLDMLISPLRLRTGLTRAELWVVNASIETEQKGNGIKEFNMANLIQMLKDTSDPGPIIFFIVTDFCNPSNLPSILRLLHDDTLKDIPKLLYIFNTEGTLPMIENKTVKRSGVEGFLELMALNIKANISSSRTELPVSSADKNAWRDELRKIVTEFIDLIISKDPYPLCGIQGLEINMEGAAKMLQEVDVLVSDCSDDSLDQCVSKFVVPMFKDCRQQTQPEKMNPSPYSDTTPLKLYQNIFRNKVLKKIPKSLKEVFTHSFSQSPHAQLLQQQRSQSSRSQESKLGDTGSAGTPAEATKKEEEE